MNWKKYLTVSLSTLGIVCSEQIIQACSDYNVYDTYPSFFGNKASIKDKAYAPFRMGGGFVFYEDYFEHKNGEDNSPETNNKRLQLTEWQSLLGGDISVNDIEAILYDGDYATIKSWQTAGKVPAKWAKNTFAQFLSANKNKSYLNYLVYAKECEAVALGKRDEWLEENRTTETFDIASLLDEGKLLIGEEKRTDLRLKYAFQILRLAFYKGANEDVLNLYEKYFGKNTNKSIAYTRALGFKAGALFRQNKRAEAAYYYAKMFDSHMAYKLEAVTSFEWSRFEKSNNDEQNGKDLLPEILALCKSPQEQAVVWGIVALRTYPESSLPALKKAYALHPKMEGLAFLVNREINKLEEKYFSVLIYGLNQLPDPKMYYYNTRRYEYAADAQNKVAQAENLQEVKALASFVQKVIQDRAGQANGIWHLAQAYLSMMQLDWDGANKAMAAAKASSLSVAEQGTYLSLDVLGTLYQASSVNASLEQELLPKLEALDQLAAQESLANYQFRDIMTHVLAGKYLKQNDTAKAIYAMAHAQTWQEDRAKFFADEDFQDMAGSTLFAMDIPAIKKVQAFRQLKNASAFEKWLVNKTYYTESVLKELEGTIYLRDYKFKAAAAVFADKSLETYGFPNPFMPQTNDHLRLEKQDTLKIFTKLSFSKRMSELQDIIKANPDDAGALYGYAVALYNISYYGKSAKMISYFRSSTDDIAYYSQRDDAQMPKFLQEYYRVYTAEQYFNKAALATNDPELKAKALWGAAKCWTKRAADNNDRSDYTGNVYFTNALKNPYFAKLKPMQNAKFVSAAKGTCDYYGYYLRKNK